MKPLPMAPFTPPPFSGPVSRKGGNLADPNQTFVRGTLETPSGVVPQVDARWDVDDTWGALKVRLDIDRMNYRVDPGLYALGKPTADSPVLLSANYKLSFDRLRKELGGRDLWLLVLDTDGVNVWCSAGKGSFSAWELARRIESVGLSDVVGHRKLIAPQLSAPGLSALEAKRMTGFEVVFGPIRAEDLSEFLDSGWKARPEMRRVTFGLFDRAAVVPVELVGALRQAWIPLLVFTLIGGLLGPGAFAASAWAWFKISLLALSLAILAGAAAVPLLLPWLPGRAFALKALIPGWAAVLFVLFAGGFDLGDWAGRLAGEGWALMILALASYLAMNFTGCTTFTSLSGVKKEMRMAVPLQLIGAAVGLGLWIAALLTAGRA